MFGKCLELLVWPSEQFSENLCKVVGILWNTKNMLSLVCTWLLVDMEFLFLDST